MLTRLPLFHSRSLTNLAKSLQPGQKFFDTQEILLHMTTNRTNKPGDEIFCTPMMIESMRTLTVKSVAPFCDNHCEPRLVEVSCAPKAALPLGARVTFSAEVTKVTPSDIEFHVLCHAEATQKVIGDATLILKTFPL
jgi:predicted thioesterase